MKRKLTREQIIELRIRRATGTAQVDLAEEFGISQSLVSMIVRGDRFEEEGGPIERGRRYRRRNT